MVNANVYVYNNVTCIVKLSHKYRQVFADQKHNIDS